MGLSPFSPGYPFPADGGSSSSSGGSSGSSGSSGSDEQGSGHGSGDDGLDDMKVADLRELAEREGVDVEDSRGKKLKRDDLVDAIRAGRQHADHTATNPTWADAPGDVEVNPKPDHDGVIDPTDDDVQNNQTPPPSYDDHGGDLSSIGD